MTSEGVELKVSRSEQLRRQADMAMRFVPPAPIMISAQEAKTLADALDRRAPTAEGEGWRPIGEAPFTTASSGDEMSKNTEDQAMTPPVTDLLIIKELEKLLREARKIIRADALARHLHKDVQEMVERLERIATNPAPWRRAYVKRIVKEAATALESLSSQLEKARGEGREEVEDIVREECDRLSDCTPLFVLDAILDRIRALHKTGEQK